MTTITAEQKAKIENVILVAKGLNNETGGLPKVKFVNGISQAQSFADKAGVRLLMQNRIHSLGDRFDSKEFMDIFGPASRPLDVAKTIDRICRCGLGTVRVHIGLKGGSQPRNKNQLRIYVEVDWDHFDQQEYLFSCKEVLMAE